jgi:hypothetical protein
MPPHPVHAWVDGTLGQIRRHWGTQVAWPAHHGQFADRPTTVDIAPPVPRIFSRTYMFHRPSLTWCGGHSMERSIPAGARSLGGAGVGNPHVGKESFFVSVVTLTVFRASGPDCSWGLVTVVHGVEDRRARQCLSPGPVHWCTFTRQILIVWRQFHLNT